MLLLFLFSLSQWTHLTLSSGLAIAGPQGRTSSSQGGATGEKTVQSLSSRAACFKQLLLMSVYILSLWVCSGTETLVSSDSQQQKFWIIFQRQGIHISLCFSNGLTLPSIFYGSIDLIRVKLPLLSARFQSHSPGSSALPPLAGS